jgi:hypothetical protein
MLALRLNCECCGKDLSSVSPDRTSEMKGIC